MQDSLPDVPQWAVVLGSSAVAAVGAFVLALVNRGPAIQAAWLAANKDLIEGYKARVAELTAQELSLRERLDALEHRCAVCELLHPHTRLDSLSS